MSLESLLHLLRPAQHHPIVTEQFLLVVRSILPIADPRKAVRLRMLAHIFPQETEIRFTYESPGHSISRNILLGRPCSCEY